MSSYVSRVPGHAAGLWQGKSALLGRLDIELTERCNNNCAHCYINLPAADDAARAREMSTRTVQGILLEASALGSLTVRFTGGEPLLREDIYPIAAYGNDLGLRMVMAANGTLITSETAGRMKSSRIQRVSISLDGPDASTHDRFRQVQGAFEGSIRGIEELKKAGIEFQINTTITRHNVDQAQAMLDLAVRLGAAAHHIFLLVPTGRARDMINQEISAGQYEEILKRIKSKNIQDSKRRAMAHHLISKSHSRGG